jgi:glutamyl-tRNA reductase
VKKFADDWKRRKSGPVIRELFGEADKLRAEVLGPLLGKLNGKLTPAEREAIEIAFRQFQNKLLHGPIAALKDAAPHDAGAVTLLEAVRKLFNLRG